MRKYTSLLAIIFILVFIISGCTKKAEEAVSQVEYNYYTAQQVKEFIEKGNEINLIDIQIEKEWSQHHIKGAISTKAYPVKTDEDRNKLDIVVEKLDGDKDIVVVCPRGGGGAKRTIDHLKTKGIDEARLFILENGQDGWPYKDLVETSKEDAITLNENYVVNKQWLKENLNNERILILDARGENPYDEGHIPGAISITWGEFSNMKGAPGDVNWGIVLKSKELSEKLSSLGIERNKEIIIYANTISGWGEDGRIAWMLKRAGYENIKILDGGFNGWQSADYEISTDKVALTPVTVEIEALNNKTNITTDELIDKLDKVKIIDTREEDEYLGANKFGEARGGHLPKSINITFNEFLNEDGTLKSATEIERILNDNGINKEDEVVTYCTAGIRSAHMQLVMEMLGYNNVKNYDASFYEWANNPKLSLEK